MSNSQSKEGVNETRFSFNGEQTSEMAFMPNPRLEKLYKLQDLQGCKELFSA